MTDQAIYTEAMRRFEAASAALEKAQNALTWRHNEVQALNEFFVCEQVYRVAKFHLTMAERALGLESTAS